MIGKSGNRFPGKIVLLPGKSTPPDEAAGGKQDHADNGSGNAVFEADVVYRGVMPGHEAWQLAGGKYEIDNGTMMHKNELPAAGGATHCQTRISAPQLSCSLIPSEKKSWFGSPEMFSNGRTASAGPLGWLKASPERPAFD
jgi:hypothetical protein